MQTTKIEEYEVMLSDLFSGKIKPSKVVGTGYKNPRQVAAEWINKQILNAQNPNNKKCDVHLMSSGKPFKDVTIAKRSKIFNTIALGEYKTINDSVVADFGVCKAPVGSGYLVWVKTARKTKLTS